MPSNAFAPFDIKKWNLRGGKTQAFKFTVYFKFYPSREAMCCRRHGGPHTVGRKHYGGVIVVEGEGVKGVKGGESGVLGNEPRQSREASLPGGGRLPGPAPRRGVPHAAARRQVEHVAERSSVPMTTPRPPGPGRAGAA